MSLINLVNLTKQILYGTGLGEKPSLRQFPDESNPTVNGNLVILEIDTTHIKPGHVLSSHGAPTAEEAWAVYVLSVEPDQVQALNGYLGSAPLTDEVDLSGAVCEQQPLVTEAEIFGAIQTVYSKMLWPEVFQTKTNTIANPNLIDGQEHLPPDVEFIVSAWQYIGPTVYEVPYTRQPMVVDPGVSPTGRLAHFGWYTSIPGWYTYRTRYEIGDEEIYHMAARGAAALCLGASLSEGTLERTKKDSADGVDRRGQIATTLWRDFLTLKQSHMEANTKGLPQRIVINRG